LLNLLIGKKIEREVGMRLYKCLVFFISLALLAVTFGCGGNGGGDGGGSTTGTVSMSITDAKPVLPDNVTNCFVTIDQVLAHSPGGGWVPLPMVQTPYTIDLLEFTDGISTEFVPPARIEAGQYTQIRLSVIEATLRFLYPAAGLEPERTEDVTVTIPSENLKTDQNFNFKVTGSEPSAVDITIDFDLSKSIVVEGPAGNPSYKLKPVLHIVKTEEAATINVTINNTNFDSIQNARITVLSKDANGQYTEEYTKVEVARQNPPGTTISSIFWLVPDQDYMVQIDYDPAAADGPEQEQEVLAGAVGPGEIADVNF
jgi:hypothetical protein